MIVTKDESKFSYDLKKPIIVKNEPPIPDKEIKTLHFRDYEFSVKDAIEFQRCTLHPETGKPIEAAVMLVVLNRVTGVPIKALEGLSIADLEAMPDALAPFADQLPSGE